VVVVVSLVVLWSHHRLIVAFTRVIVVVYTTSNLLSLSLSLSLSTVVFLFIISAQQFAMAHGDRRGLALVPPSSSSD